MMFLIILPLLTGCGLKDKDIEQFMIREQTSVTASQYQSFLDDCLDKVSVDLQKDFLTRLNSKSRTSNKSYYAIYVDINAKEGTGVGIFKEKDTNVVKVVSVDYSNKEIISYTINTYYNFV